jgi:hypothetical protein
MVGGGDGCWALSARLREACVQISPDVAVRLCILYTTTVTAGWILHQLFVCDITSVAVNGLSYAVQGQADGMHVVLILSTDLDLT